MSGKWSILLGVWHKYVRIISKNRAELQIYKSIDIFDEQQSRHEKDQHSHNDNTSYMYVNKRQL